MKQTEPPLQIARPCSMDWNTMSGDARKRFCAGCQKHVFNLSAMTEGEAKKFADETQGRECIAYVQADEGKIQTPNPVERGLMWLTHRLPRMAALLTVFLPAALAASTERREQIEKGMSEERTVQTSGKQKTEPQKPKEVLPPRPVTAGIPKLPPAKPEKPVILGEPCPPPPPPKPKEKK